MIFTLLLIACNNSFCQSLDIKEACKDCLFLTPLIKSSQISEAVRLSAVDPATFLGIKSHTGFITVKEEYGSNLFLWYLPVEKNVDKTPWIIWLGGGPGFTSMRGLFDQVGPWQIKNGKVRSRNVAWSNSYSMLFVDNPVGAGYSFTLDERGHPDNEDDIADQLYEFLDQFLQMFPALEKAPLFLAGTSYAGKYIPILGMKIHTMKNKRNINLKGLAIGNGMIDPRSLMHYTKLSQVLGLLDEKDIKVLLTMEQTTIKLIDEQRMVDAANKFNKTIEYMKKKSGVSIYNFLDDPKSHASEFEDFITRPEVKALIHMGNASFNLNNQLVYTKMLPDIMNTTKPFVEELLEYYGVMCFNGQLDIILAPALQRHMYKELKWSKRQEYERAERRRLFLYSKKSQPIPQKSANDTVVAYKKEGGNFVEVLIRNAGHNTPGEQPLVVKFLIDQFIKKFKELPVSVR